LLTVRPCAGGRIVGASKIAHITGRKEAERSPRERQLTGCSRLWVAIYDQRRENYLFNQAAVDFGRTPLLGSDEWCVTWKLFMPDGRRFRTTSARWRLR
jgi:hypothetical protein